MSWWGGWTRAAALLLLLFAGCTAPAAPERAEGEAASRTAMAAAIVGGECFVASAGLPLPLPLAERFMPVGFAPWEFVPGVGWAYTQLLRCGDVDGAGGELLDFVMAVNAMPPDAWSNASLSLVVVESANSRADLVGRYASWNVTTSKALLQLDHDTLPVAHLASISATLERGPVRIGIRAAPEEVRVPARTMRLFFVHDGTVVAAVDHSWAPHVLASQNSNFESGAAAFGLPDTVAGKGYVEYGDGFAYRIQPFALGV